MVIADVHTVSLVQGEPLNDEQALRDEQFRFGVALVLFLLLIWKGFVNKDVEER